MRERKSNRPGRIIAKAIGDTTHKTLHDEVKANVKKGSALYSDELPSYQGLGGLYSHRSVNHKTGEYVRGIIHTNSIESVWAVLKRGYKGVHHFWSFKHIQRYINEFVFRLNQTVAKKGTMDTLDDVLDNSIGRRLTYEELVAG